MVPDNHTNTVYLLEFLHSDKRFTETRDTLTLLLDKHGIKHRYLKETKDIWCRDQIPIQTKKGEFVQFRYEPSSLKDESELQLDTKKVCEANNIRPQFSKINGSYMARLVEM